MSQIQPDKNILVLNAGGTSLTLALFDAAAQNQLIERELDWSRKDNASGVTNHQEALDHLLSELKIETDGVGAVGHRIVHDGGKYETAVRVDKGVKATIKEFTKLDPLHNQAALDLIEAAQKRFGDRPQVAAFDTTFHRTLPPERFHYAVPYEWYEKWGVRRFGFHGLSFEYSLSRAAELLDKPADELRLVICHLGSGCSLGAIVNGQSVATTMGFTPLDGSMMASRSGAVDPGILLYLLAQGYQNADELDQNLNHKSGLKGISGVSSDLRDILPARAKGDERAALAYEMFVDSVRQHIGAMLTTLGGPPHAIVFTDAVAENVPQLRADIIGPLGWLGLALDEKANAAAVPPAPDQDVATKDSRARILVVHVREGLMVAQQTRRVLGEL